MQQPRKPKGDRGVAYLRISTDKQDVKTQKESIQRWLDQNKLSVIQWYEDVGSRDLAHKRADFQRLLAAIQEGRIDWVVVDAKDRFGTKSAYEFGKVCCVLQDNDCELWSITQGCLTDDDAVTEILAAVDSVRSRDEQKARSQRTLRGKISAAGRGELQGGNAPFGYDTICVGPDGREKWRILYQARWQRLRIWPDGRPPERFDGRGVFPGRDPGDTLRLAPSCDTERVEMARKIYYWFATESVSLRALAMRLNALKVNPVVGQGWYATRMRPMLSNPAYLLGQSVWNKRGSGRFFQYVDGQYQEVPRTKGRTKAGRKRKADDYVLPGGEPQGIISQDIWDAVQAKLAGRKFKNKTPKNPALCLAGLVYCGHCNCRMSGWACQGYLSYTCPTYRTYGAHNLTGCRLHRVRHDVLVELIGQYLDEVGIRLEAVLKLESDDGLDVMIEEERDAKRLAYLRTLNTIWRTVRATGATPPEGQPWTAASLAEQFAAIWPEQRKVLAQQLADKEAAMDTMLDQFAKLKSTIAIDRANERMQALDAEILRLRAGLEPLDLRLREQRAGLQRFDELVKESRAAMAGDSNRQRAAALARVIARIDCRFEHRQVKSQQRSALVEVTMVPVVGSPQTFGAHGARERTAHGESPTAALLTRTYCAAEIDTIKRNLGQHKELAHSPKSQLPRILELQAQGWSLAAIGRELGFGHQSIGRALGRRV